MITIPIKGEMTIPNIGSLDPGTFDILNCHWGMKLMFTFGWCFKHCGSPAQWRASAFIMQKIISEISEKSEMLDHFVTLKILWLNSSLVYSGNN